MDYIHAIIPPLEDYYFTVYRLETGTSMFIQITKMENLPTTPTFSLYNHCPALFTHYLQFSAK